MKLSAQSNRLWDFVRIQGENNQMYDEAKQHRADLAKPEQVALCYLLSRSIASCKHSSQVAFDPALVRMPTLQGQATQTALDCPYNATDLTIAARTGQVIIHEQQTDSTDELQGSMQADLRCQGRR